MVIGRAAEALGLKKPKITNPASRAAEDKPLNNIPADSGAMRDQAAAMAKAAPESTAPKLTILGRDSKLLGLQDLANGDALMQSLKGAKGAEKMKKASAAYGLGSNNEAKAVSRSDGKFLAELIPNDEILKREMKTGIAGFFSKIPALFTRVKKTNLTDMIKTGWVEGAETKNANAVHESVKETKKKIKAGLIKVVKISTPNKDGVYDPNKPCGYVLLHDVAAILKENKDNLPDAVKSQADSLISGVNNSLGHTYLIDSFVVGKGHADDIRSGSRDGDKFMRNMIGAAGSLMGAQNTVIAMTDRPLMKGADIVRGPEHAYATVSGVTHLQQEDANPKKLKVSSGHMMIVRRKDNIGKPIDVNSIMAAETAAHIDGFDHGAEDLIQENFATVMKAQETTNKALEEFNKGIEAANNNEAPQTEAKAA